MASQMITINLSFFDELDAKKIARSRNNKPPQWDKKFVDGYDGFDIHYMSALAEVAWAKLTGWEVDTVIKSSGDGGVDFTNGDYTYQIKARNIARFNDPDLLCRTNYAKADIFILADVDQNDLSYIRFVGWCWRDELKEKTVPIRGGRYIRERERLRPFGARLEQQARLLERVDYG